MSPPNNDYQTRVDEALKEAWDKAVDNKDVTDLDLEKDKWVIFSDHHKGARDSADDFSGSEDVYHAALGYYFEKGYHLAVLGDVEELWENDPKPVTEKNCETLELERAFHDEDKNKNKYWRFWGNHDDAWSHPDLVDRHLGRFFPGLTVRESLLISVKDAGQEIGKLLLVHGHQGTIFSDRYRGLGRFGVRYFWRPIQRKLRIRLNTPAKDWGLRQEHNIALYNWAVDQEGLVLIAGHTHRPVFDTCTQIEELEENLKTARDSGDPQRIALARARLEFEKVKVGRSGFVTNPPDACQPCYFNTGCCCYDDSDITGLEIDSGEIKLIRWSEDQGRPERNELATADLKDVFKNVGVKGKMVSLSQR